MSKLTGFGIGLIGGTVALFSLVFVTRLMGLMGPLNNWGTAQIDLVFALIWGFIAGTVAHIASRGANDRRRTMYWLSFISLAFVVITVLAASVLNRRLDAGVVSAALPLLALGPVTNFMIVVIERVISPGANET